MRRKLVERMQINIFKLRLLLVGAHLSVKEMWIFSSKEAARRLAFCPTNRFVCVINIFCLQLVGGGGGCEFIGWYLPEYKTVLLLV